MAFVLVHFSSLAAHRPFPPPPLSVLPRLASLCFLFSVCFCLVASLLLSHTQVARRLPRRQRQRQPRSNRRARLPRLPRRQRRPVNVCQPNRAAALVAVVVAVVVVVHCCSLPFSLRVLTCLRLCTLSSLHLILCGLAAVETPRKSKGLYLCVCACVWRSLSLFLSFSLSLFLSVSL